MVETRLQYPSRLVRFAVDELAARETSVFRAHEYIARYLEIGSAAVDETWPRLRNRLPGIFQVENQAAAPRLRMA